MSTVEKGLFRLSDQSVAAVDRAPTFQPSEEQELNRRILAEERTGQLVMKIAHNGYVPLSEIYKVPAEAGTESASEPSLT